MSNRSKSFRKKYNNKNDSVFKKFKIDEQTEYSILANIFCSFLGLKKTDLLNFLKNPSYDNINIFTDSCVIKDKSTYIKMMGSLSEAFKAGEEKEHNRHINEESAAFKKGVKYGREQRENELNAQNKNQCNYTYNYKISDEELINQNRKYYFNNIEHILKKFKIY